MCGRWLVNGWLGDGRLLTWMAGNWWDVSVTGWLVLHGWPVVNVVGGWLAGRWIVGRMLAWMVGGWQLVVDRWLVVAWWLRDWLVDGW